ncbi:FAD/NAD(P)-binding domain containing protein [Trema orientale]|uniref:FAD/NAD(P)-binding domain containing protein n=1 Tax=Trema orientale TaxID=63057 RepID=A0A2P5EDA4_TREOI|nr:FAD/NAD(P)-binding domain containing protein [Trema orientale]
MEMMGDIVIVGAGIAGLATAVALKRVGVKALVLERSDELRAAGAALTLFPNAWLALDALGVSHKLTSIYAPSIKGYVTNLGTGAIQEISYSGAKSDAIGPRSVHRKALLRALAEELPSDSIRFSCKITAIEAQEHEGSSIAVVHIEDGNVIKAKVLVGCDGVHSIVASWLGLPPVVHSGRSAVRGLAVFPQGHGLKQEVQQFVGAGTRAGFIPLTDNDIYWFLTCTSPARDSFLGDPKAIQREVIENYAKDFPELYLDIVEHSDLSTLSWAPLMFRQPWKVALGNLSKQNITVAGDAMHPMTPDLGQGGCSALEDAVVLGRHIGACVLQNGGLVPREVTKALSDYAGERRWRATWLIAGSFLSGWVQHGGSMWGLKFFRDAIFYKFLFRRIASVVHYDCGKLA